MPHKIVVTLHGIRTRGQWQKQITPYLARHGLIPYHLDYGFFGLLSFLVPWARASRVQWLRDELRDLMDRTGAKRVSLIAHSFGTWLALEVLEAENGNIRFDRVVLTGSIVRRDFPWGATLMRKRWIQALRNERATGDWVVRAAELFSRLAGPVAARAGASGALGFNTACPGVHDRAVAGGHSEVLNIANYDKWARFIAYPRLPDDHLRRVRRLVQQIRALAAARLGVDAALVRANIFVPGASALRMIPGAWDNMHWAPEHDIELELYHGCTGCAFTDGTPFSIRRLGAGWTAGVLPGPEQARLDPRLQWVLSLPIGRIDARDELAVARDVVGVLNVDGLDSVPPLLQTADDPTLKTLVFALWASTEKIRESLALADTGEPLHDD
ncbi:MAG TPA: alpha/beta hydrolase [Burkholderiaceae bacterium]|nr:alpha/beta hydrolase [Burkholderiaceae bacterium]